MRLTSSCIFASISWLIATHHQPRDLTNWNDPVMVASLFVLMLGVLLRSWAAAVVQKREHLATTGAYALCRHPLYLGSMLMVVGFCGLVGNLLVSIVLCTMVAVTISSAIRHEEEFLEATFGTDWTNYAQRVGALVPRSIPLSFGEVSARRWYQNREYRAWFAIAAGLVGLQVSAILGR